MSSIAAVEAFHSQFSNSAFRDSGTFSTDGSRKVISKFGLEPAKQIEEQELRKAARVITKRDYPALVTLKLAGRNAKEIARALNVSEESVRPHLARALAEYRSGKVKVNSDEIRNEVSKKAGEQNARLYDKLAQGVLSSAAISELASSAVPQTARVALRENERLSVVA